jgi:hypothetical protein
MPSEFLELVVDHGFDALEIAAFGGFELDQELAAPARGLVGRIYPGREPILFDESVPEAAASPAAEYIGEYIKSGFVGIGLGNRVPAEKAAGDAFGLEDDATAATRLHGIWGNRGIRARRFEWGE